MIKSEEQRQQEMRAAQNEWWGKLTNAEKSKATGMVLDQATGWWAVSDVDSRERLMRTYIALKENAAPAEDNQNGNTDEENSTEDTDEGTTEGDSTANTEENPTANTEENPTENSETTEENVGEETKTEEAAEQNDAEANPTDENVAPAKAKTTANKKGGKKTSKK